MGVFRNDDTWWQGGGGSKIAKMEVTYCNTCDSDLGYKYFVQQKILEFVKNSVTIIGRFLILVKLVQWIFLEIGMN